MHFHKDHLKQSDLDMFRGHGDDTGVPPPRPQDVSCCEDPRVRQKGPRAEPVVFRDSGKILHTEQNLPREQASLCTVTAHDSLEMMGKGAGGPATGWEMRKQWEQLLQVLMEPQVRLREWGVNEVEVVTGKYRLLKEPIRKRHSGTWYTARQLGSSF